MNFLLQDPALPRRRVAKKTTISKDPVSNNNTKRNSITPQRTRISTTDETYDELNRYASPSQTIIPINNNEVNKIFIAVTELKFFIGNWS
jgi:hypothetical protein